MRRYLLPIITAVALLAALTAAQKTPVIYFPLDERFATRGLFLNLANITASDHEVFTPPKDLICRYRQEANLPALYAWFESILEKHCADASERGDYGCIVILSSELFLYGGLINSRISNTSAQSIYARVDFLLDLKKRYARNMLVYVSNVVMRIPAYNGSFEEPEYYAIYGYDLYEWSYYTDKCEVTRDADACAQAAKYYAAVPADVRDNWVWRRQRNFNVTQYLLNAQARAHAFEGVWITLDDNAQYGFNIEEARKLREQVAQLGLQSQVYMYPGADEVNAVMYANAITQQFGVRPRVSLFYRDAEYRAAIPNYEGQPLNVSVLQQLQAAGAKVINNDAPSEFDRNRTDVLLLINNPSSEHQQEAFFDPKLPADFTPFNAYASFGGVIAFADVYYSNGGDESLVAYIEKYYAHTFGRFTYAGWNTDGNTLGTTIANSVILYFYHARADRTSVCNNEIFQYYRLLEDVYYMSYLRQKLAQYVQDIARGAPTDLTPHATFYQQYVQYGLAPQAQVYANALPLRGVCDFSAVNVTDVYFPWNRTFEVAFTIVPVLNQTQTPRAPDVLQSRFNQYELMSLLGGLLAILVLLLIGYFARETLVETRKRLPQ